MPVPVSPQTPGSGVWRDLAPDAKRARLLAVAHEVFAQEGLDAPMPAVAAAAGIGVGSIYRQFPAKRDLLAALVIDHVEESGEAAAAARVHPEGAWAGLVELVWHFAARQAGDHVVAEALGTVSVDPEVAVARRRTHALVEALLDAAKAEGRLRADASVVDLRLIFAGARAAERVEPGDGWRRAIELGLDALAG